MLCQSCLQVIFRFARTHLFDTTVVEWRLRKTGEKDQVLSFRPTRKWRRQHNMLEWKLVPVRRVKRRKA